MAQIKTVGDNRWVATFNKRNLVVTQEQKEVKAIDMVTGEVIDGGELHSIKNLLRWHIDKRRITSEPPALWTVRP